MVILENIKEGILSLKINKIRLVLPVLSIMFGVGALVLITSLVEGEKRFISKEIEKLGAKLIFVSPKMSYGFTSKDMDWIMKRCREVKQIIPLSISSAPIYVSNKSIESVQIGGTLSELKEVTTISLIMGRFFTPEEVNNLASVCVIGKEAYHRLFRNQHPIGQFLYVIKDANQRIALKIVGVLDKTNQQIWEIIGDEGIFVPMTVFQKKIKGGGSISSLFIETYSFNEISKAVQDIKTMFELKKIPLVVYDPKKLLFAQSIINRNATIWGYSLGILLLIIGGVGIMNIMLKSIIGRTREIGIRKSVGAKNRDILIQFLTEAATISSIGCFAGIVVGIISAHIASRLFELYSPIIYREVIFISCGIVLIESLLFGLYPAYKASNLKPINALRYE